MKIKILYVSKIGNSWTKFVKFKHKLNIVASRAQGGLFVNASSGYDWMEPDSDAIERLHEYSGVILEAEHDEPSDPSRGMR